MGTFIIRPTSILSGGTPFNEQTSATYAGWSDAAFPDSDPAIFLSDIVESDPVLAGDNNLVCFNSIDIGDSTPVVLDSTARFAFGGNSIYLDGSLFPISFAGLPSGFTPLTAAVSVTVDAISTDSTGINPGNFTEFFLQQENGNNGSAVRIDAFPDAAFPGTVTYPYSVAPSAFSLLANGCGFRAHINVPNDNSSGSIINVYDLHVEGTYGLGIIQWYLNHATGHYVYEEDPGPPFVAVDAPPLDVVSVSPASGCGAAPVRITGVGFGDGATVDFDGTPATSVIVVNSTTITCVTPAHADGLVNVKVTNADAVNDTLANGYEYGTPYWMRVLEVVVNAGTSTEQTFEFVTFVQSCLQPDDLRFVFFSLDLPAASWWFNADLGWYTFQPDSPGVGWIASAAPDPDGWYFSPSAFGGDIVIVTNGRPKNPREWDKVAVFATGDAGAFGGSPQAACSYRNHLVYPADAYVSGTDAPPIRIFDGSFDHELCKLPPTDSNGVPLAVLSMLTANGTIYLSTLDSGADATDWSGRVFQLDINSGTLTPIGAKFDSGNLPYALCWHNGRLWVGSNKGDGTPGNIYWFRPDIDDDWTLDYDLTGSTAGGACSMASFQGTLYVGTDNVSTARGKIVARDTAGAYTIVETGTVGAAAHVNNGFYAMLPVTLDGVDTLYATYWNNDVTPAAVIRASLNGVAWTTSYTGTGDTVKPFIGLLTDKRLLLAFGGGLNLPAAIVRREDAAWLDLTTELPENDETLLPIFGVEVF